MEAFLSDRHARLLALMRRPGVDQWAVVSAFSVWGMHPTRRAAVAMLLELRSILPADAEDTLCIVACPGELPRTVQTGQLA